MGIFETIIYSIYPLLKKKTYMIFSLYVVIGSTFSKYVLDIVGKNGSLIFINIPIVVEDIIPCRSNRSILLNI